MAEAPDDFTEQLRSLDVEHFLVATCSTIASVAYGKLELGELAQAKVAIDALAALVPLLGEPLRRDLQAALTGLQVAFAGASSQ